MANKLAIFTVCSFTVLTVFLGFSLQHTKFNYDFKKFFNPKDTTSHFFENHRNHFGTDNDFILIAVENRAGVFEPEFLQQVDDLTTELKTLPHVSRVVSPTRLTYPVRESITGSVFQVPVLQKNRESDSLHVFSDSFLTDHFFSTEVQAMNLVVYTHAGLSKAKSDEIAQAIELTLSKYDFDTVHLTGKALVQKVILDKIQMEFLGFMAVAILLVAILLFLIFRTFTAVLIPVVTVLIAVVWSIGLLNLADKEINLLLITMPAIIFVVGISNTVHLYSRFIEELKQGKSKEEALHSTVYDTGRAVFLTALTTAIGFGSLYLTFIPVLQDFGVAVASGVIIAFFISVLFLPAWLRLKKNHDSALQSTTLLQPSFLKNILHRIIHWRKPIRYVTAFLSILFILGTISINQDNYILEDLKPQHPAAKNYLFFENYFSGVRPFELGLKLRDTTESFLSPENLSNLEKIEIYLKEEYGVSAMVSVLTGVREVNRMYHGGKNEFYNTDLSANEFKRAERDLKTMNNRGMLASTLSGDGTYARISGRTRDLGAKHFKEANQNFYAFAEKAGLYKVMEMEITGTAMRIDHTHQNLVYYLGVGLLAAILLISMLMGMVFKSFKMVGIALIPNILPLLAIAALMYVFKIDLNMSTGIIFTIIFGIAVDDTIHLLSRYRLELRHSNSKNDAFETSFVQTGRAVILTSIVLFAGFFSFYFSSFESISLVGMLVSLALIFALVFDMVLLPILLWRKP